MTLHTEGSDFQLREMLFSGVQGTQCIKGEHGPLKPQGKRYANAVFIIFAFDLLLVCTLWNHICPQQICVNLIFRKKKVSTNAYSVIGTDTHCVTQECNLV